MIVNAKPSNSLVKTPNIKEVTQDYSTSDYGLIGSNVAAAQNAWNHGLTGTAVEWVYHHMLPYLKPSPLVTKEYYDNTVASEVGIEYNPSKTQAQLHRQIQVAGNNRAVQQQMLGKNRAISQTATSFGMGFVDPINVGLMVASAGTGIARNAYASANLAAQAGKPYLSAFHTTRGGLQNYLALSAPVEYAYATAYQDTGINDYTHDMLQMGATNSLLFGLGMSGLNFPKHVRTATEIKTRQTNDAVYRNRMDGTYKEYYNQYDPETTTPVTRTVGDNKVVDILQNVDVAADPHIRSLIDNNPRLKQIAERKLTEKDLTAQDIYDVASVLHQHETHVLLREISAELAKEFRAKEGSIVVNEVEYRATVKRIADAILKGDTSKLTKADIEFLRKRFGLLIAAEPSTSTQRTVVPEVGLISYASRSMRAESRATTRPTMPEMQNFVGLAKSHEIEYRQVVSEVSSLVNKIILGKDVIPAKVGDVGLDSVFGLKALGAYTFGQLGVEIADVYTMFDGDQTSGVGTELASRVLTTYVHETFHQLQDLSPKDYAAIEKLIKDTPGLKKILLDEIKRSGYEKGANFEFDLNKFPWVKNIYPESVLFGSNTAFVPKTQVEKVPLLMEWYITRPEFHEAAKKKNPKLYKKLLALLKGALEKAIEFLRIKRSRFFKEMDNFEKADDVAASLKKILQGLREEGGMPNQLRLLKRGIISNEHLSANSQKAYKPAYENPNFEARTRELDRQNANNIEYLEKRIADIVGDEALVPSLLSLPKQSKGEAGRQEST